MSERLEFDGRTWVPADVLRTLLDEHDKPCDLADGHFHDPYECDAKDGAPSAFVRQVRAALVPSGPNREARTPSPAGDATDQCGERVSRGSWYLGPCLLDRWHEDHHNPYPRNESPLT